MKCQDQQAVAANDAGISLDCGGEDVGATEQQEPKKEHEGKGMREESWAGNYEPQGKVRNSFQFWKRSDCSQLGTFKGEVFGEE